ncbi:MAG: hypothetical protein SFY80_15205 [Verrucomicrobiota bacterium]|nr:hypothetical protein [Verrucomicrobiota bacterium]
MNWTRFKTGGSFNDDLSIISKYDVRGLKTSTWDPDWGLQWDLSLLRWKVDLSVALWVVWQGHCSMAGV